MNKMEQKKEERKKNILQITKQVEETAKDSYQELESQGIELKKTQKHVRRIGGHLTGIDQDLNRIEEQRRGSFKRCLCFVCCACGGCRGNQVKRIDKVIIEKSENVPQSIVEEHLTPERIEKEWNIRYDPEDRWIQQVESGLDCLLKLAEQMKKSFDEQNELVEQIYLNARSNQTRMKESTQKMRNIQTNGK